MPPRTQGALRAGAVWLFAAMLAGAIIYAQGCAEPSPPAVEVAPDPLPPAAPAEPPPATTPTEVDPFRLSAAVPQEDAVEAVGHARR